MIEHTVKVYDVGTFWYLDGKRHREDGPAVETTFGSSIWFLDGKVHREDGPAVEHPDGSKEWFLNGDWHREDGPAIEYASGNKRWYLEGVLLDEDQHRTQTESCTGKVVEIDGKKYKLTEIEDD